MQTMGQKIGEIYKENIHLRETLVNVEETLRKQNQLAATETREQTKRCPCKRSTVLLCIVSVSLATCFVAYLFYTSTLFRDVLKSVKGGLQSPSLFGALSSSGGKLSLQNGALRSYLNIGMRQDYQLQECQGTEYKQSFPDLDYSFLGYNILKGYPLSVGHDPGFTYPIFTADYSEGRQTADCRYSIPRGLVVIPDVSCETSFSSTIAQTKYEFATSMSSSANVNGGGWGVHFSASAEYKKSSSEISTGEYVYIISSASCSYYFSKLLKRGSPALHPVFLDWIRKLSKTDDKAVYFDFFDVYGTHFPSAVTLGARFTHEHKMKSQLYESKKESDVDVAIEASYSGLFSVSGGFGMSYSQREAASDFSKSVQTTTITTGAAPPSNGDSMTWASTVKTSPVPIKYKLESLEKLFSDDYMAYVDINKTRIVSNILQNKYLYCQTLKEKGQISSCASLTPGIQMAKTRLYNHYQTTPSTLSECIDYCLKQIHCSAISYCTSCASDTPTYKTCYLYRSDARYNITASLKDGWQSYVFMEKVKRYLHIRHTAVKGDPRTLENTADKNANLSSCRDLCIRDANCVAFSHCDSTDRAVSCELYGTTNINGLKIEPNTNTTFVSQKARHSGVTSTTVQTTTQNIYTRKPIRRGRSGYHRGQ